ncbi:MAG TPA: TadE/TadG family type IV pilus assembly protein [Candidatus Eremiobacteraceae bacterium]|nr:TadE/TadG family type IV pilus assembly protein [Candidatus Eremiobacteraceae bacterium]
MTKRQWKTWRWLARDAGGTEIVEAAMTLPLLFMFLIGIFWFGLAFFIYGTLAQGTRAGAEAAVAPVCTTCAAGGTPATIAQTAVYNALAAGHLSKNNLVAWGPKWPTPLLCACGTASKAACSTAQTCDSSVTDVCVQENVQLSYPGDGGAGTCGTSVSARYQYPFHFSIPLTDLDLGNVLLPGQAEMRSETQ